MSNFDLSSSPSHITAQPIIPLSDSVGEFMVKFWGVRGLIPTPSSSTHRYGGNTPCVEMYVAGKRLIFDGGTGLRILGKTWQQLQEPLEAHLFFTNSQSNHIQGFPFFAPAFVKENSFHIYGTAASNSASIKQCLCDQMLQPLFPYPLQAMQSQLQFHNITAGSRVNLDDVIITTALVNHNQRSVGYRITHQKYSVVYITDLQENLEQMEGDGIFQIIQDTDLLIANATYNPPTAYNHQATDLHWKIAVKLAKSANVKQLVISQHHPDDNDDCLDQLQLEIQSMFPQALLAWEGLVLSVGK